MPTFFGGVVSRSWSLGARRPRRFGRATWPARIAKSLPSASFVVILALFASFAACGGAVARADELGWFLTPRATVPVPATDLEARRQFLKILDERQDAEFRKLYVVDVPEVPTGVPVNYDLLIYGKYTPSHVSRLEVRVRGDQANLELALSKKFYRQENVPSEAIDRLVRQLAYAALSTRRFRNQNAEEQAQLRGWSRMASHSLYVRIEIRSRDPAQPFHLRTDSRQTLASAIETSDAGLPGFFHTLLYRELSKRAYEEKGRVAMGPELGGEITARLRALPTPPDPNQDPLAPKVRSGDVPRPRIRKDDPKADTDKVQLAEVERLVYSSLAVECRAKEALGELQRLGMSQEATMLRVATEEIMAGPLLREALLGENWHLFRHAFEQVKLSPSPLNIDLMLDVGPQLKDEFRAVDVLHWVERQSPSAAQIDRVREWHRQAKSLRLQIATARILLWTTDDDDAFQQLVPLALVQLKFDGSTVYAPEADAMRAVLEYASESGQRRPAVARLIRQKLDAIPAGAHVTYSYKDLLTSYLGKVGDASDIPRLQSYISDSDRHLNGYAIASIAQIDPEAGIARMREQIVGYLGDMSGEKTFNQYVSPYEGLAFWRGDRQVADLLDAAIDKYASTKNAPDEIEATRTVRLVARYLRAEAVDERVKLAAEYMKNRGGRVNAWTRDVGRRLIAAGASPESCRPLLEEPTAPARP